MSTTDQQMMERIQYVVQEPPDLGATWPSGLWTQAEVLDYLNERQSRFLKSTLLQVGIANTPMLAGVPRVNLPSDWIATVDCTWFGQDGTVQNLHRSDSFEIDHADPTWETTRQTPLVYMDYETPTLMLQVGPLPLVGGILEVLYVPQGAVLDGTGELLTIQDTFVDAAAKYGALADMFAKDGRGKSPERATYCESRVQLGVEAAEIILRGWV